MSFIVEGTWLGRPVRVSWRDGVLVGPPGLSDLIWYHARLRSHGLGPPVVSASGERHDHDALGDAEGALLLIRQLLDSVDRVVSSGFRTDRLAVPAGSVVAAEMAVPRRLRLV